MTAVIIGIVVGVAAGAMRMYGVTKNKKAVQEIMEYHSDSPFECYRYSLFMVYFSAMMLIPGGYGMYLGFKEGSDLQIILGVALMFLFMAEAMASYQTLEFYYNDKGCILKGKFVRYRDIRGIQVESKLMNPEVVLFNGTKYNITKDVAKVLAEKGNFTITELDKKKDKK